MVTVAKSLDIPIKLIFPRPPAPGADPTKASHAMLGLGDVVLPGIIIGLALRFDLYLFYLRKQTHSTLTLDVGDGPQNTVTKPKYFSLSGRWSERFWTHSWTGRPPERARRLAFTTAASLVHQLMEGRDERRVVSGKSIHNLRRAGAANLQR